MRKAYSRSPRMATAAWAARRGPRALVPGRGCGVSIASRRDNVGRVTDGLSAELREALDGAPDDERVLLELRLAWTGLDEAAARIAARLRVFLVTWDPL